MKKVISLTTLLLLISCSSTEKSDPTSFDTSMTRMDTIPDHERLFIANNQLLQVHISKHGDSIISGFYNGDTLNLEVEYIGDNALLINDHTVGVRPSTKNININRKGPNNFELIINEYNADLEFSFEPYLTSKNVVFENSYFDSIKGFITEKYGHTLCPYLKTRPIEIEKKLLTAPTKNKATWLFQKRPYFS